DDDITDDEDILRHDLAESDNEDLINMLADGARSYGGDGGGEDRPLHTMYPAVAWVALLTETSTTQEYPSLIHTFFMAHTVNGEFLRDEDRHIYLEEGSSEGTLPMWVGYCRHGPQPAQGGASGSSGCGDEEEGVDHQNDEDEDGDGDT
nr:hypothetical protein [Tanacetum cinerariifolium]